MSQRQLKDLISGFADFTHNSESPPIFHLWAAVSMVASAMQRKVYFKWGHSIIYPNMYVVLVGPSGRSRKSDPINIARSFVEKVQTVKILGEDNSLEAIIRTIFESVNNYTDRTTGRLCVQSATCCFLEELSVFTGEQNTQLLTYLTNWYDSRNNWKRTTKHQGTDDIAGMCFNLCAATAPDWIPYIFTREAVGGGFSSRCIFVVDNGSGKIVADPNLHPPEEALRRKIQLDLGHLATVAGEMKFSPEAHAAHVAWYLGWMTEFRKTGVGPVKAPAFDGYNARRATHLIKLCMSVALSRHDDLVITLEDWKRAKAMLEIVEKHMAGVFSGLGKARYFQETEMVLSYLANRQVATRSEILRQFYRNLDDYSLDIVIKVLAGMNAIKIIINGKDVRYEFTNTFLPSHMVIENRLS